MNIAESITASLESWGNRPVMVETGGGSPDRVLHSEDFRREIEAMAEGLIRMGVEPHCAVPMFLGNSIDFTLIFLALIRIGAIPVMVKLDYRTRELTRVFDNLDPDIVITEKSHLPVLAPWLDGRLVIARDSDGLGVTQHRLPPLRTLDIPEDVASINYTYRGYGYPLGSMAPHGQYLHGAKLLQASLMSNPEERMLVILPMSHIFTLIGCVTVPLLNRVTAYVTRTFNPRGIFQIIEKQRIDHLLAVPELYELFNRFRSGNEDLSSLQSFISGGSHITPEKFREYEENFGIEVLHGYGLTEFTPAILSIRGKTRPGTIGFPGEGIDCRFDENDGEILIRSPHLTRGYYRCETETREAFAGDYFRTGDTGVIEDGHIVFRKEKKRTRKINGAILDLTEVEDAIREFPAIDRFRLEYQGGKLTAYASFKGDDESGREGLRSHLISSIARYKVPMLITGEEI